MTREELLRGCVDGKGHEYGKSATGWGSPDECLWCGLKKTDIELARGGDPS